MQITQSRIEPDVAVIAPVGRLTLGHETTNFEAIVAGLISQGERKVVLDMTEVDYIDSAGLGVIVSAASKVKQAGGAMRLARVGVRVMQVLKLTHMDTVLEIDPDPRIAASRF